MLLKLSLLFSTIGIIACNVPFDTTKEVKYEETNQIHQRNYQHSEYLNSYTEVVYKYETNEVSSVDDLVVGNIYNLQTDDTFQNDFLICYVSFVVGYNDSEAYSIDLEDINATYMSLRYNSNNNLFYVQINDNDSYSYYYFEKNLVFRYSVYNNIIFNNNLISYVSQTDYNEIVSVIYHQPQTIIGYFNEFLEENLFSEIPYVRDMTFNVGGQNINLLTYLIIAFGLIVSVGILIGLFLLLRWLFKIFANLFIMR